MGNALSTFLADPAPPGSPEDTQRVAHLRRVMDSLEVVKKLRANPDYVEWEAYDNFSEEEKPHRLTSGPLSGSRNLAVQVSGPTFCGPQLYSYDLVSYLAKLGDLEMVLLTYA